MSARGVPAEGGSTTRLRPLRKLGRREEGAVVAGICSGFAHALGVDPTVVRLVFAILTLAGGSGIVLYLGLWLFLPPPEATDGPRGGAPRAAAIALLALAAFLLLRGIGLAGSLLLSAAFIAVGVALVSLRSGKRPQWSRLILGIVLVVAGTTIYVNESGPFGDAGAGAPGAVAVALVAIVGPWLWRLASERDAERLERIRTQERAEVAARVHDSVMQTLALIQRDAEDPRRVATLARQQERELRAWLYGRGSGDEATLVGAIDAAAAEVEELHGVRVDVVSAGDAPLDDRLDALVLAAREAMTNAAKFARVDAVSVYVEAGGEGATVFVRDRGIGFVPGAVPPDRHGVRESIELRMARHGGTATVTSAPGAGTEVELRMGRRE
ncbi:MAG TPA: PspC domain-containing protein [Gaiellaceae bacterium]|nr:PspC domain-containing protein [Gaiellaceae bacterium]